MIKSPNFLEWQAHARGEGKVEFLRVMLLNTLHIRFPAAVSANLAAVIEAQTDPEALARSVDAALGPATTLDEIRAALKS